MVPAAVPMHLANAGHRREPVRIGRNGVPGPFGSARSRGRAAARADPLPGDRPATDRHRSMTVRSRCPGVLLRHPVRSVKLQGTSFAGGAFSRSGKGRTAVGTRIPRSREECRPEAAWVGGMPRPTYSERNRSQTVVLGADRRLPVGGPAARAALSSPVGPSPSKSLVPWLVLSTPDRGNRARTPGAVVSPAPFATSRAAAAPVPAPASGGTPGGQAPRSPR